MTTGFLNSCNTAAFILELPKINFVEYRLKPWQEKRSVLKLTFFLATMCVFLTSDRQNYLGVSPLGFMNSKKFTNSKLTVWLSNCSKLGSKPN